MPSIGTGWVPRAWSTCLSLMLCTSCSVRGGEEVMGWGGGDGGGEEVMGWGGGLMFLTVVTVGADMRVL